MEIVPSNDWIKLIDAGDTAYVKPIKHGDVVLWCMSTNKPTIKPAYAEPATKANSPNWHSAPNNIWFSSTSVDIEVFVNKATDTVAS